MNKKKIFKIAGYLWLIVASILILIGYIGVYIEKGWAGVEDLLNPFNIINYLIVFVTIYPGIWLLNLSKK